jgi:4-hydroxy-tetrahydrodipicolinate reductase
MDQGTAGKLYRVAQWATGNIGSHAMRAVIEHPQMELVGLWVHSDAKAGRDAGELCGLSRQTGVKATRRIEDILALKPDCVIYAPLRMEMDEVCRILESGANIATPLVEFHHQASAEPEALARVEAACRRGGSSFHATGSSPGFISENLPVVLALLQRRLDLLTIDEFADLSSRNSPPLIFEYMGWGKPARSVSAAQMKHINDGFEQSYRQLADSLSIPIDRVETTGELGVARERTEIAAGVIEAGTAAATRIVFTAYRDERPVLRFRANWYATRNIEQRDWDLRETGWRVQVQGDTPLDVSIRFPVAPEDYPKVSPGFTAHPVVNAIPAVCEAEPGVRTSAELKVLPVLGRA